MSMSIEKGASLLSPSMNVVAIKAKVPEARDRAIKALRALVESKIDERNGEDFTRLMNDICRQLFELVKSPENSDRVAGIMAIDEVRITYFLLLFQDIRISQIPLTLSLTS